MPTIMITGASRGIGLEFTRQFAADGWSIIAACRDPDGADDLQALDGDISLCALDVDDGSSVAAAAVEFGDRPIDVLINNAGIIGGRGGLRDLDYAAWSHCMTTNVLGPIRVIEHFSDQVLASERKQMVFISSMMGSIERCAGGAYIYRSSKAALNMAVKCLSLELGPRGATAVMFHPGHVRTDMGGPAAPVLPRQSVAGMKTVIEGLKPSDNGRFLSFDGSAIPW